MTFCKFVDVKREEPKREDKSMILPNLQPNIIKDRDVLFYSIIFQIYKDLIFIFLVLFLILFLQFLLVKIIFI